MIRTATPLVLLAALAATTACSSARAKNDPPVAQTANPVPDLAGQRVEVAVIQLSGQKLSLSVPGEVEAHRDASLAAALGGYIERVAVRQGDRVAAGQTLASVDAATHGARLQRAEVEQSSARREHQRSVALSGTIPQAEIDAASDRVEAAEAALKELRLNASRALVRAPFAGTVTEVFAEVGEVAAPGTPLFRLVQLAPVNVSVALSDRDIGLAREGQPARVEIDARAETFQGVVKRISKAADPKTRSFEALVEVANEDEGLLPGMIARVTLDTGTGKEADSEAQRLVVAQDWLVTRPDGVGAFVETAGVARWRSLKLGEVLRTQVVVEEGLSAGDALIITGHRELVDGDRVLVHRRGLCCVEGRVSFEQ